MHDDGTSSCGTADTGKESDDVSGAQTSEPADRGIRQTDSANSDAGGAGDTAEGGAGGAGDGKNRTRQRGRGGAWVLLIGAGVLEAVWAHALGQLSGFGLPLLVFLAALLGSTIGLALAMQRLPTAVAYSVWTGIGASLAVIWGMVRGSEPVSALRIALLALLVACVVGLHAIPEERGAE
ncbi:hypothetical protein EKN07_10250 [Actinobaculum sp. 352]|nr:hypothetical protein EKN07_10250 [Actinobaculum sp. 352]